MFILGLVLVIIGVVVGLVGSSREDGYIQAIGGIWILIGAFIAVEASILGL